MPTNCTLTIWDVFCFCINPLIRISLKSTYVCNQLNQSNQIKSNFKSNLFICHTTYNTI